MLLPANPNAFSRSPLDRAAHRRRDPEWLAEALASDQSCLIPFFERRPFVREEGETLEANWLSTLARTHIAPDEAPIIFLGVNSEGSAHFAIEVPNATPLEHLGRFDDLRAAGPRLPAGDLAILGCAKALFEWHVKHRFCSNCGARSLIVEAGWRRDCPICKAEHFPRTDPVVIMVPIFGGKCLLGRQERWPKGMHSAIAGFVEPGETVEEAVARETLEEVGLVVTDVRLHSTQPWPFPTSLMIGAIAEVEDDRIVVDTSELESARWFSRDQARLLIKGNHPDFSCPPPFAIAHQILKSWTEQ